MLFRPEGHSTSCLFHYAATIRSDGITAGSVVPPGRRSFMRWKLEGYGCSEAAVY